MRGIKTTLHSLVFGLTIATALAMTTMPVSAQSSARAKQTGQPDSLTTKDRLSIKTNAFDWLLTIPNATVEFDVSKSPYSKNTFSLGARYNWETSHKYKPNMVFNVLDAKLEFRHYWRTTQRQRLASDTTRLSFWGKIKQGLSKRREHPRTWRAYYVGGYVSGGTYSMKFGSEGKQGQDVSAGFSLGYSIPLYGYRGHYVDLELGGSIGAVYTKYDTYKRDIESNSYVVTSQKPWHVLPYPVVTDVNISFVYRFQSIKDKYKLINYEKIARKQEAKQRKIYLRDSTNAANKIKYRIERREREWQRDSLNRAKEIIKVEGATKAVEEKASKSKKKKGDTTTIATNDTIAPKPVENVSEQIVEPTITPATDNDSGNQPSGQTPEATKEENKE